MALGRFLLNMHSLIWFQENNPKISKEVMYAIQNFYNEIYF